MINSFRVLTICVCWITCHPVDAQNSIIDSIRTNTDTISDSNIKLRTIPSDVNIIPSIPTSPQANSFQRVGDFTVNNASGIPDISIPLYEIDHYGYKVPLALRYIATPLKPGYNYDVTGHGWALTIGSCISRTINSAPDEDYDFRLSEDKMLDYYHGQINGIDNILKDYNFQHDRFNVVLPDGRSFYFYIHNDQYNGLRYVVSDTKFNNIQCLFSTGNINGFILYDDNGVKYTFDISDYTFDSSNYGEKVSWYLSSIVLPNASSPILLSYDANIVQRHFDALEEPILILGHQFYTNPTIDNPSKAYLSLNHSIAACNYRIRLLTEIQCGVTKVVFQYQDVSEEPIYNYLKRISIHSGLQTERIFQLSYDNFDVMGKKVSHLRRITVRGNENGTDSLVYNLDYYSIGGFQGTDHWGNWSDHYYSYNIANMNLYAEFDSTENADLASAHLLTFLQKDPSDHCPYQKMKIQGTATVNEPRRALQPSSHGVLRAITYPNGGRTVFEFENHRFVTATAANGDYIATKRQRRVIEGGGFRIRSITNYTADNHVADIKQYRYGPTYKEANQQNLNLPTIANNNSDQHIGFGEPVVDPNILTYARFRTSNNLPSNMQNMLLGLGPHGEHSGFANLFDTYPYTGTDWKWECRFSPVFFRSLLHGRNAVVYPEITEYHGDIGYYDNMNEKTTGKVVYKYDIYDAMGDSTYYMRLEYIGNVMSVNESYFPKDYMTNKSIYTNELVVPSYAKNIVNESYSFNTNGNGGISDYVFTEQYLPGLYPNHLYVYMLFQSKYIQVGQNVLTGHTTHDFTNNGTFSMTETYSYNEFGVITKKNVTGVKGREETYTRPSSTDTTSIVQQLLNRNMKSTLLQSQVKTTSPEFSISGKKIDYAHFGGKILPSRIYGLPIVDGGAGSYEEEMQVLSYTTNGNPQEVVDRSGMHTVYLWGYNDRYLIAEIKNATLSQVTAIQNSQPGADLRTALPNSMVSTWSYRPLVGITSHTDAAGITTYYDYDSLGRLTEVYRYQGNIVSSSNKRILNQYTYHTVTH